jgi:hypothetical protein
VVALIVDRARATRNEAERLRLDSESLRFAARRDLAGVDATNQRAVMATTATRRALQVGSPWSRLAWLSEDGSLARTLVPLD